jgi:hypothetical protein
MRLRLEASLWVAGVLAIGAGASACSSGLTPPEIAELYSPCAEGTRVGDFSLWVMASGADTGASVFNGRIWDHRSVSDYQRAVVSDGACSLMENDPPIPCTPACAGDDACYPDGTCAPNSITRSVGSVKLMGLLSGGVSMEPLTGGSIAYSSNPGDLPYPAAAPGAAISLVTSGGDYAPFRLAGRGVTPLLPRTGALAVTRNQALTIEWGAPSLPAATRLMAHIYLGGDGSLEGGGVPGAGHVVCDFPDTGSGTIPASLLDQLIDQGVGTAPLLSVQRLTVSSTQIGHGCVDFSVVTPGSQPIVVNP